MAYYRAVEDGSVTDATITQAVYDALALPGAGEPSPRPALPGGKTWVWAYAVGGVPVFPTALKNLIAGTYYINQLGAVRVQLTSRIAYWVPASSVTINGDSTITVDAAALPSGDTMIANVYTSPRVIA